MTVKYLDPLKTYEVRSMDGKVVTSSTGYEIMKKGFTETLDSLYSGDLFEIAVK